jgi:Phosphatidylinositol-glycan biosynthesis class S protein
MVPRWGGLHIFNPPLNNDNYTLTAREIHLTMRVFMQQLRDLMGVESVVITDNEIPVTATYSNAAETSITELELDRLQRKKIVETLRDSKATLSSLYNLIKSLENMVLLDTIVDRVTLALDKIEEASSF